MTLIFQRHWSHWRVPSSPRSRWGLQEIQWPVSRPYLWGGQDHTLPNEPSMQKIWTCWSIPIELSQARADVNLNQDLRGNLSELSPRESHQSEETLWTVPLGQFQAQKRNIFCDRDWYKFQWGWLTVIDTCLRKLHIQQEVNLSMRRPAQGLLIPGPQHPPKVKYVLVTITDLISVPAHSPKVKYLQIMINANSESSSRETSRPSSPESDNLTTRTLYSHPWNGNSIYDDAWCHSCSQRTARHGSDSEVYSASRKP